ncbi:MAG: long-chain-fatty-acid--CoA ligase [Acidobacteriaceae bacterium]|nr:long-chain-fatty-acid--CoA ligase [Acidobacteriaceae bacterium]MBV9295115.1 long-chain-fatty-acid--CoA ligase [Acidobacteriaceae bacterium]MBV9767055.1 long-chain-fatty-acid--CoA ligase [Acidobacteriaceae bacterium]
MNLPLTPIRCLYRAVDLYGRKIGVVSGDRRFTYAQFGERCERLAAGLLSENIAPGDRVAYLSFNNNQLLEGYYGVPLIRAIVMPLNVRLTGRELSEILNHADARILIFENDFESLIETFRAECPDIERYISINQETPRADFTFEELLSRGRLEKPDLLSFHENEIAELFYTSGSTGTPKGVTLSHRTLYLHALGVTCSITQNDRFVELHTIPLFHANGWGRPQTATMNGAKQVMVRRFEPAQVLRLIQDEQATGMSLVPVMANALLNCPELGHFDTSSLKDIHLGGAAASPELVERLEQAFQCTVMGGYGLTETCPVATSARTKGTIRYLSEEDRLRHMAMAGWPIVGNEIRVVDSCMQDVARDMESVGEVVIRGDNVMDGYFKEPEATQNAITNGWLHTGDMAVWDEENYIHIVDRKKDIIISGGENISSIEVERAIFAHPAVLECAVVSAPDAKWGEIPLALVVLKPDHQLETDQLLAFLQCRLAKFKLPHLVQFVQEPLPKTGTGKILKRELRETFWRGKERRVQGI